MDIDLVYLWVNGNDPKWIAKRQASIGDLSLDDVNCKGRYVDNQELKYSLRSVEKYAPWIHKIFIVTDDQVPEWLDTSHPKIQIVDHTEIMPPKCLPCFNSVVIEHHLHKIPGLAEHFLYANDDMSFNQPVTPDTFFAKDALPIMRMNWRPFKKLSILYRTKVQGKHLTNYKQTIHNAALLVEQKYGSYYSSKTHHNIDAYLKDSYEHVRQVFDKEISATLCNHVRAQNDIQRNIYSYVPLAEKRAHLCYVTQHTSFRFHIDNRKYYAKFKKYNPVFFCMNDSQFANDDDRRHAATFLQQLFPDKSQFEKL
ncbi:MAG: Stealth CR1 domain-containing protein [Bacteroidaceae bacterium]|nr:Stealth CR1 domain-containing protein [Bacteroidaceae bacterium]